MRTAFGRSVAVILISLISFLLLAPAGGLWAQTRDEGPPIQLKSRQFSPPPGLETALQARLATQDRERLHVLAQLPDIPDQAKERRLAANGVQLLDYVPDLAWFASVPANPGTLQRLQGQGEVRWFGLIEAGDKIAPGIQQQGVGPWAHQPDGRVDLRVSYFEDVNASQAAAIVAALGGSVVEQQPTFHRLTVRIAESQIQTLGQQDEIQWIIEVPPPPTAYNNDARRSAQVDSVQSGGNTGSGVSIGIWDGGSVYPHTDFGSRLTIVDAVGADEHATHVAGTIGGAGAGNELYKGMAPGASLYSYDWNNPVAEHQDAVTRGVVESSNSWGYQYGYPWCTPYGSYQWDAPEYDQISRGIYGEPILVMFAAGNNGTDTRCSSFGNEYDTISPPATAKNIIAVGAVNSNDVNVTSWSSRGPMDDGRLGPIIVAPGCQSNDDGGVTSTVLNNGYKSMCGTSMATPATTGVAALVIKQYQNSFGKMPLPSTTKALLIHTATDRGNNGPDYRYGYGMINAQAATQLVAAKDGITEGSTTQGDSQSFSINVTDSPVKATLVWSDKEATENAAKTLVNDLDLQVTCGSSTTPPWKLNPSSPGSSATKGVDSTNPVEQVVVNSPGTSTCTAKVTGTTVPAGPQSFSLIVSGGSTAVVPPPTPPSAPSGLTANAVSSSQVNLSWTDASTNEDGFKVERSKDQTNWTEIAAALTANTTTYSDKLAEASTTYYYRVRAFNTAGNSDYSNTASAATPAPPAVPAAPSDLTATAISRKQIDLAWTDNATDETGFRIERCKGTNCSNFSQIATVNAGVTSYSNTGLSRNTVYTYRVRAYNDAGNSAYSNTASARTLK